MKKILYIFALVAFTFTSCEKNENILEETQKTINPESLYSKTEYNFDMRDFAMAVNEAINTNKSFKRLIKEEALKKFDGDYDILLSKVAGKLVGQSGDDNSINTPNKAKSNITVRDLLNDAFFTLNEKSKIQTTKYNKSFQLNDTRQKAIANSQSVIDELITKYPKLQISVPIHAEDLEDESYIPPVTFIPEEFDEENTKYVLAFDENELIAVDASTPPDKAIIVISENERISLQTENVVPPTPTNLTAQEMESGIYLNWNMPTGTGTTNTSGFKVYRKKGTETNYTPIFSVLGCYNREYIDKDVTNNVTYRYYIVAFNDYEISDVSNYITITPKRPEAAITFSVAQEALNRIKLNWTFGTNQYNGNVKVYKRNMGFGGTTSYGSPIDSVPMPADGYFDTNVTPGQKIEYKIERETALGNSIPKYDFIYTPYRDMSTDSKVIIGKVKFSDPSEIESWLRGYPEFKVKVLTVKGSTTTVVEPGLFIEMDTRKNDTWTNVSITQGMVTRYWNPGKSNWYDCLSFYFFEDDTNNFMKWKDMLLFAEKVTKTMIKDSVTKAIISDLSPATVIGTNIDKWAGEEDEQIGYAYLYYYDYPKREYKTTCKKGTLTVQFNDIE